MANLRRNFQGNRSSKNTLLSSMYVQSTYFSAQNCSILAFFKLSLQWLCWFPLQQSSQCARFLLVIHPIHYPRFQCASVQSERHFSNIYAFKGFRKVSRILSRDDFTHLLWKPHQSTMSTEYYSIRDDSSNGHLKIIDSFL
jgi:hypothetical protein